MIYELFEEIIDKCEDVVNIIEGIVLENVWVDYDVFDIICFMDGCDVGVCCVCIWFYEWFLWCGEFDCYCCVDWGVEVLVGCGVCGCV